MIGGQPPPPPPPPPEPTAKPMEVKPVTPREAARGGGGDSPAIEPIEAGSPRLIELPALDIAAAGLAIAANPGLPVVWRGGAAWALYGSDAHLAVSEETAGVSLLPASGAAPWSFEQLGTVVSIAVHCCSLRVSRSDETALSSVLAAVTPAGSRVRVAEDRRTCDYMQLRQRQRQRQRQHQQWRGPLSAARCRLGCLQVIGPWSILRAASGTVRFPYYDAAALGHGDDDGQADGGGDNGWGADGLPETMQGSLDEFVGQVCVTTRAPVMSVCACDLPFVSSWAQDATLARLQKDIETRLARVQIGEARRLQRAGHPTASPAGWYFQAGCEQQPPTLQQKALS